MKQNPETWVGIFLLAGIALVCGLIIYFGQIDNLFRPSYEIHVRFANASGLLKGSEVYLSGAEIGKVTSDPRPIPGKQQIEVDLRIDKNIVLRKSETHMDANGQPLRVPGDSFVIGSSGLLGDRFVEVKPYEYAEDVPESSKAPIVQPGDTIIGDRLAGIDDITEGAEPLLKSANEISRQVNELVTKLNQDVLTPEATQDLHTTVAELKQTVQHADEMIQHTNELMEEAKAGKGPLGRLVTDKKLADDIADMIHNLKVHGPLFYSDTADEDRQEQKDNKK